jgi:hypothetical protein
MTQRAGWDYDEDRTYHGVQRDEDDRIEIELVCCTRNTSAISGE